MMRDLLERTAYTPAGFLVIGDSTPRTSAYYAYGATGRELFLRGESPAAAEQRAPAFRSSGGRSADSTSTPARSGAPSPRAHRAPSAGARRGLSRRNEQARLLKASAIAPPRRTLRSRRAADRPGRPRSARAATARTVAMVTVGSPHRLQRTGPLSPERLEAAPRPWQRGRLEAALRPRRRIGPLRRGFVQAAQ